MDYKEISDDELIMMINEESTEAKDILYTKYKYIVDICVKKYQKMAFKLGMDIKDLNQEALVGFSDAINSFDANSSASLKTFITLCMERRLQNQIIKASRKKNRVLNEALSLEYIYNCFDSTLADVISDNNENDPLEKMAREERYHNIVQGIFSSLSKKEQDVLYLMIDGLNYQQIALVLNQNSKSIDNTIQRIKSKVKNVLNNNNVS